MNKTNPWMVATIFLLGLILGFAGGRFSVGNPQTLAYNPPAQTIQGTNSNTIGAGTVTDPNAGVAPSAAQTAPDNNYTNIQTSTDGLNHYSIGNKDAKVKVQDFSDFQCPFCYRYYSSAFPQILSDYIAQGKIYYTWMNYPLNIHPQAPDAAEAASCAGEQNKFWEYHDLLFANQNSWSGDSNANKFFESLAQTMGLDTGKFNQCLTSNKYSKQIQADMNLGDKKGVSGTPTVFVNDNKIVGAQDYSVFKQAIDAELNKK